jgi:uncharacterized protein
MNTAPQFALPEGLPIPTPESDQLSKPFWDGLQANEIRLQRCGRCQTWQWGPEWICHRCHSFDMQWTPVAGEGVVYIAERVWHPAHKALKTGVPYLIALVEIPAAQNVRMIGNLLCDPMTDVPPGTRVKAVFEHHQAGSERYSLLQWTLA